MEYNSDNWIKAKASKYGILTKQKEITDFKNPENKF